MRLLKRWFDNVLGTWLAGLIALLPLILTISLLAWVVNLLHTHLGPESLAGRFSALFGQPFTSHPALEYVIGSLLLIAVIYPLGLIVQSSLQKPLLAFVERIIRRIPLVGKFYSLADRFVGLLDQKQDADLAAMSPVWCLFGGEGIAVLALLPNSDAVVIDEREYVAILVPTAPVPIGGGLLYVPREWIRPSNIGVDKLTSIYVSMGMVLPPTPPPRGSAARPARLHQQPGPDGGPETERTSTAASGSRSVRATARRDRRSAGGCASRRGGRPKPARTEG